MASIKRTRTNPSVSIGDMPTYVSAVAPNWDVSGTVHPDTDPDGFAPVRTRGAGSVLLPRSLIQLQTECWDKFNFNPQIFTSILDTVGRMTGRGFLVTSPVLAIREAIRKLSDDYRNRLHTMWRKWAVRARVEGELFLVYTIHPDGFIEIDFRDPATLKGIGKDGSGIVFHPSKTGFPLLYQFEFTDVNGTNVKEQIPSINMARYPSLWRDLTQIQGYDPKLTQAHKDTRRFFKPFGGYRRFVVAWDMGFLTGRNLSHLRTTIEWSNYYEELKRYEIDHKRSSGAYLWVTSCEDPKMWNKWKAMTKEERMQTGIMQRKVPGGTLILPPGFKLECKNPQLPKISDSDTDILHMVSAGLNAPEDVLTGNSGGSSYAAVKASRGPMSDRTSDITYEFATFLRYEFWGHALWIQGEMGVLPKTFKKKVGDTFKNKKAVFAMIDVPAHDMLDIGFPISDMMDMEPIVRAIMGVKHGSLNAQLGISNAELASRLGIADYTIQRLNSEMEKEDLPELQPEVDQDAAMQEGQQEKQKGSGEAKKSASKSDNKKKQQQ